MIENNCLSEQRKFLVGREFEKQNILNIVRQHKAMCDGTCEISTMQLLATAIKSGLDFSEKEMSEFA